MREVNYEFSDDFIALLEHCDCSLLVSTYSAGKLLNISGDRNRDLVLGASNFKNAMGIALSPRQLAIGGQNLVWFLKDVGGLAPQIEPAGTFDRAFVSRESFVTGDIQIHEMAFDNDGVLWVVNTMFSCLCTLHESFNFVERWRPPFISALAAEDRCHLNGLAMVNGRPKYVTALGTSDSNRGWRDDKATGGVVIDIESNEVVADGFCMPHSPHVHDGRLYVLDSGRGALVAIDLSDGRKSDVAQYPGYGRGMDICGQYAFIGMSKARETSIFGGVPICKDPDKMRCGIAVVDLQAEKCIAYLEFKTGIGELFDVKILRNTRQPVLYGPFPTDDDRQPLWIVPNEEEKQLILSDARSGHNRNEAVARPSRS